MRANLIKPDMFYLIAFVCLVSQVAMAQNVPQYSLHMLNRYQFNPAFGGMDASLSITGVYRTQWLDLPGNPVQQNMSAHMPFYLFNGAVGMSLQSESIGAQTATTGMISYNYVLETDIGLFSGGVAAGITQMKLDGSILRAPDGDYEGNIILHNDANLPNSIVSGIGPVFSAGVYYAGDLFEAGIAVTDLRPGAITADGVTFKSKAAINFFGEYFIESFDNVALYPSIFIQSDLVQTQTHIAVRAVYDRFLTGGLGLRGYSSNSLDAVVIFGGLKLSDHLTIAYAFDLTLSAINQGSRGSHEVTLNYNLNKIIGAGLAPPAIYNPRFL